MNLINFSKEFFAGDGFNLPFEKVKKAYELMLQVRRFEERAGQVYTQGGIGGFCHLYIGQEAVVAAASQARNCVDTVITAYRSHGHALSFGLSPKAVMAELMGRSTGCSKGKGGSMHMFCVEGRFYGGHGIVGAQTSLGTGLAFSHQYKKDGGVCLTFLGDGAANQGQFFESMNMASLWGLPVLYIIENNGYAMGTSVERACAGASLAERGQALGVQGYVCTGEDFSLLYQTFSFLLEKIRKERRPALLEVQTYRFRGHSMSDPARYRSKEELESAKQSRDPIKRLRFLLEKEYGMSSQSLDETEHRIKEEIKQALVFAENSPEPCASQLYTDVFSEEFFEKQAVKNDNSLEEGTSAGEVLVDSHRTCVLDAESKISSIEML